MPRRAKRHGRRPSGTTARRPRESSARRGYGYRWQQLRLRVLAAQPLCTQCERLGLIVVATEVDHRTPTKGITDPNHFETSNLDPLCKSCHSAKTIRDTREGKTR